VKIAIDAGHGAETAGKRSPDATGLQREFHFNLPVALEVGQVLKESGVDVIYTHDENEDISLKKRTDIINAWDADAVISIHANAYGTGWNGVQGIETFIHDKPNGSGELAHAIQSELIKATGRRDRGVKQANFHMLRESRAKVNVLVECGFMTNKEEAALLLSPAYRNTCAGAIVAGIKKTYQLERPLLYPIRWEKAIIDGQEINTQIMQDGRMWMPLRVTSENLGATVNYKNGIAEIRRVKT
jgi:N-acetylmuramoyl-L-alanine amidase